MNRPDNIIHAQFPRYIRPHSGAELSRMVGDPDAAFIRNRLSGPARHEVIGFHPRVPLWEWLCCMAVAAAVGAMMVSM